MISLSCVVFPVYLGTVLHYLLSTTTYCSAAKMYNTGCVSKASAREVFSCKNEPSVLVSVLPLECSRLLYIYSVLFIISLFCLFDFCIQFARSTYVEISYKISIHTFTNNQLYKSQSTNRILTSADVH